MAKEKKEKEISGMGKASKLMEKILKNSTIERACRIEESQIYDPIVPVKTRVPMLNLALSGKLLDGGITPGIIQFCGPSKSFKSSFSLELVASYLEADPENCAILFDNELGTRPAYFQAFGVDTSRLIWIPFQDIEELSFELTKQLDGLEEGDKVIFCVDSLGQAASKRERTNLEEESGKMDLSRPRSIKALFRVITPKICLKQVPAIFVNHTYGSIGGYISVDVIGGGQGSILASNSIFIIGKQKLKEGDSHVGYKFALKVFKSRDIKDNAVIPINVTWDGGINKWSGLALLAESFKIIEKVKEGRSPAYQYETLSGNIIKVLEKDIDIDDEFWETVFKETDLAFKIESSYKVGSQSNIDSAIELEEPEEKK